MKCSANIRQVWSQISQKIHITIRIVRVHKQNSRIQPKHDISGIYPMWSLPLKNRKKKSATKTPHPAFCTAGHAVERGPRGVTPREPPRGLRHRAVPAGEGRGQSSEIGRGDIGGGVVRNAWCWWNFAMENGLCIDDG